MGFSIGWVSMVGSVDIPREERQPEGISAGAAHCELLPRVMGESVVIVEEKHPDGISAGAAQRVLSVLSLLFVVS